MKGIILAGGKGSRLWPITAAVSKQLLPIYNKPMIYYPLSVLMLAGIREVLVITTPWDLPLFQRLLGDGSQWGLALSYATQDVPRGLADAFLIGESFIGNDRVAMILGDNLFFGNRLIPSLQKAASRTEGATLFGYRVKDPQRYGVVVLDKKGEMAGIKEKPAIPPSKIAVTGLYFYDNDAVSIAKTLHPSARDELEITDLNQAYIDRGTAHLEVLGRGLAWLDTGTYASLLQASHFVQVLEERQGTAIASVEEIAFRNRWITAEQLEKLAHEASSSPYGHSLQQILEEEHEGISPVAGGRETDPAGCIP